MTSLINAASPLVWDATMLGAAEVYAAANQATIITPFILAGAMAPATSAGVAAQTLAEALAGMAFIQLVRPGAPVVSARSPARCRCRPGAEFGTPEPALVLYAVASSPAASACHSARAVRCRRRSCPTPRPATRRAETLIPTLSPAPTSCSTPRGGRGGLAIGYEKFVLDATSSDDGDVRQGPRPQRERPGARRHPNQPAGAALPRHAPTRWPTSRPRSAGPRRPTTRASSSGARRAPSTPPSTPTGCGRSASPPTSHRRSTTPSTRSCASTSPVATPSCRTTFA